MTKDIEKAIEKTLASSYILLRLHPKRNLGWEGSHELTERNVLAFIREMGSVIIPELTDYFDGCRGEYSILAYGNKNLVIWSHLSEEFITILEDLDKQGEIRCRPVLALRYTLYGTHLDLPPVKDTGRAYKRRRWFPVQFIH